MRREERVTVQGPVKEQQPDGMSHRGVHLAFISVSVPPCTITAPIFCSASGISLPVEDGTEAVEAKVAPAEAEATEGPVTEVDVPEEQPEEEEGQPPEPEKHVYSCQKCRNILFRTAGVFCVEDWESRTFTEGAGGGWGFNRAPEAGGRGGVREEGSIDRVYYSIDAGRRQKSFLLTLADHKNVGDACVVHRMFLG